MSSGRMAGSEQPGARGGGSVALAPLDLDLQELRSFHWTEANPHPVSNGAPLGHASGGSRSPAPAPDSAPSPRPPRSSPSHGHCQTERSGRRFRTMPSMKRPSPRRARLHAGGVLAPVIDASAPRRRPPAPPRRPGWWSHRARPAAAGRCWPRRPSAISASAASPSPALPQRNGSAADVEDRQPAVTAGTSGRRTSSAAPAPRAGLRSRRQRGHRSPSRP